MVRQENNAKAMPVARKSKPASELISKKHNASDIEAPRWEEDFVGDYLLHLFLEGHLRKDWYLNKSFAESAFQLFVRQESLKDQRNEIKSQIQQIVQQNKLCVESLLRRTGYLLQLNAKNCDFFWICSRKVYAHRNRRKKELAKKQMQNFLTVEQFNHLGNEFEEPKILPNSMSYSLIYQGSSKQTYSNIVLTNFGCFICQRNFDNVLDYENHIEYHNENSGFKCLSNMLKKPSPTFNISYQLCENSHHFCFTISADVSKNKVVLIIDKIIIVQTRSMLYVYNTKVPFEVNEKDNDVKIFLDPNIFRRFSEQPFVIIYRQKGCPYRYVEQHHFFREEEFPAVNFPIHPTRLSSKKLFKPKQKVAIYSLSENEKQAFTEGRFIKYLTATNKNIEALVDGVYVLDKYNYDDIFSTLLKIEDNEIMKSYLHLSARNVTLDSHEGSYIYKFPENKDLPTILTLSDEVILKLECDNTSNPGLSSSLDSGCDIFGRDANQQKSKIFQCFITGVTNRTISFEAKKNIPLNEKFSIMFRPNRLFFRYQFKAVESVRNFKEAHRLLFPTSIQCPDDEEMNKFEQLELDLNNKSIQHNPEQLLAIKHIVCGLTNDAPFIIYGPPGTGKTSTLVEAVFQLYKRQPNSKILITAGSNSACDEIALRLCSILTKAEDLKSIVRVYARSNEYRSENIHELLLENSNMFNGQFYPDVEILHNYRIIVATVAVIGKLATGNFGLQIINGTHSSIFTHIIIDEAAALTEPQTIIPIVGCAGSKTRVIIAGDTKQLRPITTSITAKSLGLEISLMERLLGLPCYQEKINSCIYIKLVRNFRSHPQIVNLFSNLYYNSSLIPMICNQEVYQVVRNWHLSLNKNFPIIFHALFGQAKQKQGTSSYFNMDEIVTVMDYIQEIMFFGICGKKVSQRDIGIVTPYKSQYIEIQERLNMYHWTDIETGAVETFQGREKSIIIVSFVRSNKNSLGFLDDPRRLNVLLSRAKSFIILIGNPETLSLNRDIRKIIEECKTNNTYIGQRFNWNVKKSYGEESTSSSRCSLEQLNNQKNLLPRIRDVNQNNLLSNNKEANDNGIGNQNKNENSNVNGNVTGRKRNSSRNRRRRNRYRNRIQNQNQNQENGNGTNNSDRSNNNSSKNSSSISSNTSNSNGKNNSSESSIEFDDFVRNKFNNLSLKSTNTSSNDINHNNNNSNNSSSSNNNNIISVNDQNKTDNKIENENDMKQRTNKITYSVSELNRINEKLNPPNLTTKF